MTIEIADFIAHHGVKGMKWGVINEGESDREVAVKKGDLTQHITSQKDFKLKNDRIYASYTKRDNANYAGNFAMAMGMYQGQPYAMSLKANKDLVVPSQKKKVIEFMQYYKDHPAVLAEMAAAGYQKNAKTAASNTKKFEKMAARGSEKDFQKLNQEFIAKLPSVSKETRDRYFGRLQKQGFNALYDDNDMFRGTKAERPLIIINGLKDLSVVNKRVISQDEARSNLANWRYEPKHKP